tara:strand:- start:160 stop:579 length:420 start_codon:yes stop_codon:yes gene_type:complete
MQIEQRERGRRMTTTEQDDLERISIQAGEAIFGEGDFGDRAYIVEDGIVEISRKVGGEKMTLGTVERNGIFGEMALIDESNRIASAVAVIDTVLIPVPKVAIQSILANADPLLRKLVSVLVSNARSLSDHIARVAQDEK